jgi:peroxiredoxin
MKYTRLIVLMGVAVIIFAGAAAAYNQLSGKATDLHAKSSNVASLPATSSSAAGKEGVKIGNLAYDFSLKNYDGNTVTLSSLRGKIVILNFWASWCNPCKSEMPGFQNMQAIITAQGADADTTILTVNLTDGSRETRDTAHDFLTAKGYTFPVVFDENKSAVANLYQITGIPATYILNKNGVIVQTFLGATSEDNIKAALDLARKSVAS